jgi:hypothetical protein
MNRYQPQEKKLRKNIVKRAVVWDENEQLTLNSSVFWVITQRNVV